MKFEIDEETGQLTIQDYKSSEPKYIGKPTSHELEQILQSVKSTHKKILNREIQNIQDSKNTQYDPRLHMVEKIKTRKSWEKFREQHGLHSFTDLFAYTEAVISSTNSVNSNTTEYQNKINILLELKPLIGEINNEYARTIYHEICQLTNINTENIEQNQKIVDELKKYFDPHSLQVSATMDELDFLDQLVFKATKKHFLFH